MMRTEKNTKEKTHTGDKNGATLSHQEHYTLIANFFQNRGQHRAGGHHQKGGKLTAIQRYKREGKNNHKICNKKKRVRTAQNKR